MSATAASTAAGTTEATADATGDAPADATGDATGRGREEFELRIEPYRGELLAHCYRMVGSVHDAEDLVQDTYLRAWRSRDGYDSLRASLRTWLYRIATNVCLTALKGSGRRPLPSGLVEQSEPLRPFAPGGAEAGWLQPIPDSLLRLGDPAGAAIDRGSLRLAFVAAMQHLSARERAALILREVLEFSAAESAEIIGVSSASVNSALQRARARLRAAGVSTERQAEPSAAEQRRRVEEYMAAFVRADVEGIKRLLADDVLMEMPPMLNWFTGRENYGAFMGWVFDKAPGEWRTVPIAANGQPGFVAYHPDEHGTFRLHTLHVFTVGFAGIVRNTVWVDEEVWDLFGLERTLPA